MINRLTKCQETKTCVQFEFNDFIYFLNSSTKCAWKSNVIP